MTQEIKLEQNTDSWLAWRHDGIGGSDAPVIMGVSEHKTRHQLWLEKTGPVKFGDEPNYIQTMGHVHEPRARAAFEAQNGFRDMPPKLAHHPLIPWLKASLDGWDGEILEIKFAGREDHEGAKAGRVPDKYFPQLQHQMLVTGAERAHYWSWWGEKEGSMTGAAVTVEPDLDYMRRYLREAVAFWALVQSGRPPAKVKADFRGVNKKAPNALAREYARLHDELQMIREQLLLCEEMHKDEERLRSGRVWIDRAPRYAPVRYDRLSELASQFDLAAFMPLELPAPEIKVEEPEK